MKRTTFGTIYQDWDLVALPNLVFFQEGPGLRKWQWAEYGMKVINVTNIVGDGSVDVSNTSRFISMEEFTDKYSHFEVEEGDIVVASSGNTYGKVGRINRSHLPLMMNTSVIRFHPNSCALDVEYLYAYLRSHFFKNQVESLVIGSAQPNFGPLHLKQMKILKPPIETQRRIASVVSAYDDLIENNTRRIKILEEMAQGLYREWFVHFRFPGHEKVKMVPSSLGPAPEGWRIIPFSEIARFERNGIDPSDFEQETFAHYSIPAFDERRLPMLERGESIKSMKYHVEQGHILLSKLNPRIPRVWLVRGCGAYRAISSTEFLVLRPVGPVGTSFLFSLCQSVEFLERFAGRAIGTSTSHQRVKPDDLFALPVCLPSTQLIEKFSEVAGPVVDEVDILRRKNEVLRRTRDLLLPRLISGEIDVSNLDLRV